MAKYKAKGFKRLPIEAHRKFLEDPQYRHQIHAHISTRLKKQEEDEYEQELKDYLNGKESL